MKIGFDLDGVIAKIDIEYYKTLLNDENEIREYYLSLDVKINPKTLLGKNDIGWIVTGRSPCFRSVTEKWLVRNKVRLPYIFTGDNKLNDWSEDNWLRHLKEKEKAIKKLKLDIYFEDTARIVDFLREHTKTKIIKVNE